ncbi:hypothetical protein [Streptomyces sp. NPDC020489]|uniref:hypothetical protein n=1 Tax=Streptomyces sp. NPDC020489 TaxID=3365077 RepID=UPI0037ABFB28
MRENNWREEAQPEWPAAAPGTRAFPTTGYGTQAFPDTRGTDVLASTDRTDVLPRVGTEGVGFDDPWTDTGHGNAHDPHEVTVQLDAVALRADSRLVGQAGPTQESSDGPVFVDESGRRSRRYRRIGIFVGLACAVYAVVIVMTLLSGNSNAPWLPVPGQGEAQEAGQVDTTPLPGETVAPSGAGTVSPGVSPSVSGTTAPSASATAPGSSVTVPDAGTPADPAPTATTTTPGTGSEPAPDPEVPTTPATTNPPDPTPTEDPTPDPTQTLGGDSAGTGTDAVAGAPVPAPVSTTTPPPESTV